MGGVFGERKKEKPREGERKTYHVVSSKP